MLRDLTAEVLSSAPPTWAAALAISSLSDSATNADGPGYRGSSVAVSSLSGRRSLVAGEQRWDGRVQQISWLPRVDRCDRRKCRLVRTEEREDPDLLLSSVDVPGDYEYRSASVMLMPATLVKNPTAVQDLREAHDTPSS